MDHDKTNCSHDRDDGSVSVLSGTSRKTITLKDVKGEFETEAESTILSAIERKEIDARREETDPDGVRKPSFLEGIPSSKVHLFVGDGDNLGEEKEGHEEDNVDTGVEGLGEESGVGIAGGRSNNNNAKFKLAARRVAQMKRLATKRDLMGAEVNEGTGGVDVGSEDNDLIGKANSFFRLNNQLETELNDVENQQPLTSSAPNDSSMDIFNDIEDGYDNGKNRQRRKMTCYRKNGCCSKLSNFFYIRINAGLRKLYYLAIFLFVTIGIACLLFYVFDNPIAKNDGTTYSWYFTLFARFGVTFTLAILIEVLLIDYLFLETNLAVRTIGRFCTLMAVHAKGWPLRIAIWGSLNFVFTIGNQDWRLHWLHNQEHIRVFNNSNPGPKTEEQENLRNIMLSLIILGVVTMFKRAYFAYFLGTKRYAMYNLQLKKIMRKVLIVSEIAIFAEEIENDIDFKSSEFRKNKEVRRGWLFQNVKSTYNIDDEEEDDDDDDERSDGDIYQMESEEPEKVVGARSGNDSSLPPNASPSRTPGGFNNIKKKILRFKTSHKSDVSKVINDDDSTLAKLLGEWKEPEITHNNSVRNRSSSCTFPCLY